MDVRQAVGRRFLTTHKLQTNPKCITKKGGMLSIYLKKERCLFMNTEKLPTLALGGVLLVGCLTVYKTAAASQNGSTSPTSTASPQPINTFAPLLSEITEDGWTDNNVSCEETFKLYEQFVLTYDAGKNELLYNGKVVRWFEDYYPIADTSQAGRDFFNENGVVDVYAVRDLNSFIRSDDGSFDPSGKLVGVKEFSKEEFAARNIEAIKTPPLVVASFGGSLDAKELEDMAKEYAAFGVTYDAKKNQWYFNGEKVCLIRDVLTSDGESLTNGKFHGAIRTLESINGTIDIYTIRDFTNPNTSGHGSLTGIEKFSQFEFDEHTKSGNEVQYGSGECAVIQE